ncbi:MAG: glycosyltransferase [Cytophagales bacterium]|nr:glycosyltransferase [Cytophagales bacterium]
MEEKIVPIFKTKLGTITQTNHWAESGEVVAYEPYVREMRIWADLFEEVKIFTPFTTTSKQGSLCGYNRPNIKFQFVRYNTQIFRWGFLVRLIQMPIVFAKMAVFIWQHDFLLIRSPGHFAFMAHILVVLFRKRSITKFAGYFGYFKGERIPSIVERFWMRHLLSNRNLVLVYGKAPKPNFISYFPLLLSNQEIKTLEELPAGKKAEPVFRFYSLGRLIKVKGYDLAILGLGELFKLKPEWNWHYHLLGDGPEQKHLLALARSLGIADRITFEGSQSYLTAMQMIKQADAVIMPGVMEGWPKVVVEAWVAGTIPICANAGLLSEIISQHENGFLFEPDSKSLANVCLELFERRSERIQSMIDRGRQRAKQLTSDCFQQGLVEICKTRAKLS